MEFRTSRQCIIMGKVESSTKAKGEDMSSLCMRKFSLSVQREGKKNKMLTTRAKRGKQSISLEPGGQFELSGMPLKTLHQTCDEINSHLYQAKTVAEEMGIGFLGLGFQPKWRLEDIPGVPKDFMASKLPAIPGQVPTLGDWENHLITIFPEVTNQH
ncbi:hypothetical protein JHK84_030082 [Glycine max]|nr:hypothetical protein JHK84_030082 [Glycine max]